VTDKGATMRLGSYPCVLGQDSLARKIYGADRIAERHRHRFEVNGAYVESLSKSGMNISGLSPDGRLPEMAEIPSHPFFVACQFHPEFKSDPKPASPVHGVCPRVVGAPHPRRGVMTVAIAILSLGFLVFVHELGIFSRPGSRDARDPVFHRVFRVPVFVRSKKSVPCSRLAFCRWAVSCRIKGMNPFEEGRTKTKTRTRKNPCGAGFW